MAKTIRKMKGGEGVKEHKFVENKGLGALGSTVSAYKTYSNLGVRTHSSSWALDSATEV